MTDIKPMPLNYFLLLYGSKGHLGKTVAPIMLSKGCLRLSQALEIYDTHPLKVGETITLYKKYDPSDVTMKGHLICYTRTNRGLKLVA